MSLTVCSTDVESVTSHVNACACPPAARISAIRSSSASALRASANTVAPRSATAIADARPIPLDAPVMMTCLPTSGPAGSSRRARSGSRCSAQYRHSFGAYDANSGTVIPVPRNASAVLSEVNVGARSTTSRISPGMPSWVAAMLRNTLARPVALRNGVAVDARQRPAQRRQPGRVGDARGRCRAAQWFSGR